MSKQYCYEIINPDDTQYNQQDLETFVKQLYIDSNDENKFKSIDELPFIVIFADTKICIMIKGRSKKNIEKIENIHNSLKKRNLKFNDTIKLNKPKLFDIQATTWWDESSRSDDETKWSSLLHQGPYFTHIMEPYKFLNSGITYKGERYLLNPEEEEVASFYAKRLISEQDETVVQQLTTDKVFNDNFWNDFKTYLSPEHKRIFKKFSNFNWDELVQKIRDSKTALTEEQKTSNKIKLEKKKHKYGIAIIDGNQEKVGNFVVEPPAIFYGRGDNPKRGKVKPKINPEDVIINIGENDPVPIPPEGHEWNSIVHDNTAVWLAKWTDPITGNIKYVFCSMEGKFKGKNDLQKYEKARKLEKYIDLVRERYTQDIDSRNMIKKQLGTVLWFIDNQGIRVGNEKDEDEADTVGASTLRVEHIKFEETNKVIFDFLGKDSVHFYKKIIVPENIFNNIKQFVQNKNKDEQVFDKINSASINSYLKTFDKNFSAKVFRTRLASTIMFDALKNVRIPKNSTKANIKKLFNKANAQVATVLNHTRNVSKKAQNSVQKVQEKLETLKKELGESKSGNSKIQTQINKLTEQIEAKTDVMSIAITTSLNNYIDPRLVISWCKSADIEPSNIYTTTLLKKFKWAIEITEPDWDYRNSPLKGNQDLEPVVDDLASLQNIEQKPTTSTITQKPTTSTITQKPTTTMQIVEDFNNLSIEQLKILAKKYNCNIPILKYI